MWDDFRVYGVHVCLHLVAMRGGLIGTLLQILHLKVSWNIFLSPNGICTVVKWFGPFLFDARGSHCIWVIDVK